MTNHADPAAQRHAAQYTGRNHRQFETLADHGLPGRHARGQHHARKGADDAMNDEDDDLEGFLADADGLAVGEDISQTANDLHGRQCRDQRIDAQLGDDDAVDQAHHQTHGQRRRDAEKHAVGITDDDGRDNARAGQYGADRQVEMPGGQAIQHRAGGNADRRNR
nr:hypothetical protein [Tanacetum cinerariifolium]